MSKRQKFTKAQQELERQHGFTERPDFHEEYETLDFDKEECQIERMTEMDASLRLLLETRGRPTPEQWMQVSDWRPSTEKRDLFESFVTVGNDKVNPPSTEYRVAAPKVRRVLAQRPMQVKWSEPLLVKPGSLCSAPELQLIVETQLKKTRTSAAWQQMKNWPLQFQRREEIPVNITILWFHSDTFNVFVALVMQGTEDKLCLKNYLLVPAEN